MKLFKNNLEFYIENYNSESALYKLGGVWGAKGWLTKEQFMTICLWKSRRPKKLYAKNKDAAIKMITRSAFKEKDERKKIELLTSLHGVQVPTASAILSVTDPEKYPIIDRRCVETLQDLKLIEWNTITNSSWIQYLNKVREIAKHGGKSARDIEKGLFAYNRIKLDRDLRNLYI